jgi:hypothetical protein
MPRTPNNDQQWNQGRYTEVGSKPPLPGYARKLHGEVNCESNHLWHLLVVNPMPERSQEVSFMTYRITN